MKTIKNYLNKLITILKKGDNIIAIMIAAQSSLACYGIRVYLKDCPIGLYCIIALSTMLFFTLEGINIADDEEFDRLTSFKRLRWTTVSVFVTFLYFMLGISWISILISVHMFICKQILFYKDETGTERVMTWQEIKTVLHIA